MKSIKVIGCALLLLLLSIGSSFAQTPTPVAPSPVTTPASPATGTTNSSPASNTPSPSLSCEQNKGNLKQVNLKNAETECTIFADFYVGVELIGSNEFAEGFPRAGLRFRSRLVDYEGTQGGGLHVYANFGLTSRNVQNPDSQALTVEGSKAIEGEGGLLIDIKPFSGDQNRIAFLGVLGFDSVEDIPLDPAVMNPDGPSDIFQHHFAGLRVYHTGSDRYNGAYADVGWGVSENFRDNEEKRFKFRGYLPVKITKGDSTKKFFAAVEVDSDFDDGEDEVKLIFGLSVEFKQILSALSLGIIDN